MPKGPVFTDVCYGIIALLKEKPDVVFALTQQRIAERMEKNGWLARREIELPQQAGNFHYQAKFTNFFPTENGLALYEELHCLVGDGDGKERLKKLQLALNGEYQKENFLRKMTKEKVRKI